VTALIAILAHTILNVAFGWTLLSCGRHQRSWPETLLLSVLIGMYAETLMVAVLIFFGVPISAAALTAACVIVAAVTAGVFRGKLRPRGVSLARPVWYEWLLLGLVGEKILFASWQLVRTHTYFHDALMHWSGRARSLYGQVNWSLDPESPVFLAGHSGSSNYPLQTIIWRTLSAALNGGWNEAVSRADGLIFFIVIIGTIWAAVLGFSNARWLAAAAAFVISALPLHVWHAAAGYSDIAVEAFVVASLAALLRAEWFLGGVMAAGAAWSKNDALALYFPALLAAVSMLQWRGETRNFEWRNVARFLAGFATLSPWLIFNYIHGLGITPAGGELAWHSDAPGLFWEDVLKGPTSSILWISLLAFVIYAGTAMAKDQKGRALILAFGISLGGIFFVFSSTAAYTFLDDQSTIHRVMMQFSGMAVLVMAYGVQLKARTALPLRAWAHRETRAVKHSRR
jgi:hypothetical protein